MAVQLYLIPEVSATGRPLPQAGPTGSLKPLGLLMGEQEHPWQKAMWRSNPQLLWSSSSGHWSQEVPALPHCTAPHVPTATTGPVAAGQEPSKEQCGSGPGAAPALQALRLSPSLQCQHQEKPTAPRVPRAGLAVG